MTRSTPTLTRYGASRADIDALMSDLGEPAYRTNQLWEGLWTARRPLEELTSLSKALRERLRS